MVALAAAVLTVERRELETYLIEVHHKAMPEELEVKRVPGMAVEVAVVRVELGQMALEPLVQMAVQAKQLAFLVLH
jgi:hypothetical protein